MPTGETKQKAEIADQKKAKMARSKILAGYLTIVGMLQWLTHKDNQAKSDCGKIQAQES